MFHVEHLWILLSFILLVGCDKKDPQPELKDPIYQDMLAQKSAAERGLADAEKSLEEKRNDLKGAEPQTGKISLFQKRVFEAEKVSETFRQQIKYWTIRIRERALFARRSYSQAFSEKKPWPDPNEYSTYLSEKKLRLAKIEWDAKQRLEDYKSSIKKPAAAAGHGAPPPSGH